MSPTLTSPALVSGVGVLLGTAAYMSPEQAKGRPADKRSDIWAFGWCVQRKLARSVGNRPTRARVRSPVAWIARRRETNFRSLSTKPSSGWRASHRAVTRVNAQVTPKAQNFGGRAPQPRAKAAWSVARWLTRQRTPAGR